MAASGKKQKKLKGKTVELSVFLADEQRGLPGGPGSSIVRPRPTYNSWADEVESQDPEAGDYPEIPYKAVIDRSMLPTAPRAARGPDIDLETVPKAPPFVAYIGNLPYDLEQDKIYKFFLKLKVSNIRLPTEKGRLRGFGYVDFEDRDSLIEALSMNDDMIQGRKIRIALPGNMDREDRRGGADEDRTDCDWRRGGDDGFGDRDHDRGGYGDRDRDRGGGYGDRDRDRGGFGSAAPESGRWERMGPPTNADRTDRYESAPDDNQKWDRGHKVDSSRGDRWGDRGGNDRWGSRGGDDNWGSRGGNDRWGSRGGDDSWGSRGNDRWNDRRGGDDRGGWGGDRDRGYGGDRDRGYGGGSRYRDDDRGGYGGRRNYGSDRGYDRRGGGGGYGGDGGDRSDRTTSRDSSREPPRDRPKLQLQPRTKPKETVPEKTSSIFGGARPVDTSQREKEIEERLRRQEDIRPRDEEKENLGSDSNRRNDRPYRGDGDRESRRERRLSSNSNQSKGIKPAPLHQSRTRRDSNNSNTSDAFSDEREEKPAPPSPRKEDAPAKMVPAPPPKENIWERRKTEQKGPKDHSINEMDSNRENDRRSISSDDDKRGGGRDGKAHPKEREMPKSYEDMPQYQDTVKKDWTDANKFNFLDNEDEDEYQENLS